MKRFNYLWMAGLMTFGLWACSDDADLDNGGNEINADNVYMSFNLELPTASRSQTNENNGGTAEGVEEGKSTENNVSNLVVVLASRVNDNSYTYITNSARDFSLSGSTMYTVTFQSQELENKAGSTVAVFVFCNYPGPTSGTPKEYYQNLLNGSYTISDDVTNDIAAPNAFWMTNAQIALITLPTSDDLPNYNTATSAFDLGIVNVERTAARFDFSPTTEVSGNKNTYILEGDVADPAVTVQLTDIALVNMSNTFNHIRRVSASEITSNNSFVMCGQETRSNYVADADAIAKIDATYLPNNFNFYWPNYTKVVEGEQDVIKPNEPSNDPVISFGTLWPALSYEGSVNALDSIDTVDNNDNWTSATDDYKVWRYATENTMPTKDDQIKSLCTGVVFRGHLAVRGGDDRLTLSTDVDAYEDRVYVFNNKLYGSHTKVKAAIATVDHATTDQDLIQLKAAWDAALATTWSSEPNAVQPKRADAAAYGFTVYSKNDDGNFYVYYYYVNRHNDNNDDNVMGPMEYAVVRNNVYKLKVTDIHKFGHPEDPEGDPTPEKPMTPSETEDVYFTVTVKVLPWVIRQNNIEF